MRKNYNADVVKASFDKKDSNKEAKKTIISY